MRRLPLVVLVVAGWAGAGARPAAARPSSVGWFAEGGLGAVKFVSKASSDADLGPTVDVRIGRDPGSVGNIVVEATAFETSTTPAVPVISTAQ